MSLKIYVSLLIVFIASLVAFLIIADPEQIKSVAFNPTFLIGALAIVGYTLIYSKNRYLADFGALLALILLGIGVWSFFEIVGQFLNDYNIKIVTEWRDK